MPCSLGSGTGPGGCTCLSVYSRKCQSSVRSLAPVRGTESPGGKQSDGLEEACIVYIFCKTL